MLTTLHTPPFTWLESAIGATAGSGGTFAAVSRHTAAAWGRVLDRVIVVPNGVDVHRWPAGAGGQYLVWSGRITPEKGTHLAIAAAGRSGLRLILAGPVGNADYFREKIQPEFGARTTYAGHLRQDELAGLVGGAAAALVTPLWDEPYGLVVAEALACGTPVVAFARGGIPEVVDAHCGRLVKPRDVAAMAAAVPEVIGLSRTAVRDRAVPKCSAHTMVESYLTIYRDSSRNRTAPRMIGYYVHHQGRGHLARASSICAHLRKPVTVLSSIAIPDHQHFDTVRLPRDDAAGTVSDPTANGTLHWAPLHDNGFRERMRVIAEWVAAVRPEVMVVDVSVEVAMLVRLSACRSW